MKFQTFSLTQTQSCSLKRLNAANNRCTVFRLEGRLDEAQLEGAIKESLHRCPPFSYKCLKVDGGLQILLSPDSEKSINVIDVDNEETVYTLIENYQRRVFRLDGGAPYLFCLLRGKSVSHLVFVCHPWLIDRFSLKPFFKALSAAYNGEELPEMLGLPQELLLEQEKTRLVDVQLSESMRFCLQVFRGGSFEWRPARREADLSENYFCVKLSSEAKTSVVLAAKRQAISVADLLLFCFHLFLYRMTRNETVMTVHCHRICSGSPGQIGFSENKPLFRSLFDPNMTASRYFKQADRLLRQTRHHADLPAGVVSPELLRLEPDFRWPTNVFFDEDTLPYREFALNGAVTTLLPHFSHLLENEDIAIYFDVQEQITFHVLARSLQEIPGLQVAFSHYLTLLENINADMEKPVSEVRLLNASLQTQALSLADGGKLEVIAEDVLAGFVRISQTSPNASALRFADKTLSYRELSLSAGSIASNLKSFCNGKTDPLVGICLSRSERMIQAVYGILAAGAGYLPLDPTMPAERLSFIVNDAQLAIVIADDENCSVIAGIVGCPVLNVNALLNTPRLLEPSEILTQIAQRTAYVIYTSGTTGKPKGVVIERGMLAHFVASLDNVWEPGPGSRWLQFASLNFDASVMEIFNPLMHGGELVLASSEVRSDPEAIFALLQNERITHAYIPPAMLRLLPRRSLPDLRSICCGGEATDEESVRFWSKTLKLSNAYGPTETTVMATINTMGGYKSANQLGRPLPGYFTYILDANGGLTPIGGVGEICIGGPAVARGYLGRSEMTAQKFEPNPFGPGRIYHSGDLGRFLPNGDIEFLGRGDFQVKIRGFRIELGDIENAIAAQPEVKGCYVGVFDRQGGKNIQAWYIASGLTPEVLHARLALRLPQYMIPTILMPVDSFPLNLSGKIDRTRLPMPENKPVETIELSELDGQIRDIWATTLNIPVTMIGPGSQFFHLGGHSLLVALVCNRLNALLGGAVRPKTLFEYPIFANFCDQVRATPRQTTSQKPLLATSLTETPNQSRLIRLIYSRAMRFPEDNTYNIVVRVDFSAQIHPIRLRQAFGELLKSRPEFRIALIERGDEVWIKAGEANSIPPIPLLDSTRAATDARAESMRTEVLGVRQAPLWRAEVHCREDSMITLLFNVHHAIFDGWSFNLLLEELGARYEANQAGGQYSQNRLTWFDYCHWAVDLPKSDLFKDSICYWKTKLAGMNSYVELPVDFRQKQSNANAAMPLRFEPEVVTALKAFADEQEITLSPLLFSLWLVWLWRISGQESLACGYPYAGRDVPGSEDIYGMFVTMGILFQQIHPNQSLCELILAVHRQMLEDKDHLMATPYDAEVGNPEVINVIFSLQSGIGLEGGFGGAIFKADELPSLTSKADLTGIFYKTQDGGIEGRIEFDSSLFRAETVSGFLEVLRTIVHAAAKSPKARLDELAYLSDSDFARIQNFACGPQIPLLESSIPARFSEIVKDHPEKVAVIFETRHSTYRQLDDWSNRIAVGLGRHVQPGSRVGISMQKSDTLVASVLAILKLDCAYVPLDSSYPPDRVRFFAENAAVRCVIADAPSREALGSMGLGMLDFVDPDTCEIDPCASLPVVSPDSLAYIIHTSGSTGKPKGVMIEHQTVVRLAIATSPALNFDLDSVGGLIASLNFDASVLEIFSTLLNGLTLVVIPELVRKSPALLHQVLIEKGITHVILSPVVLQNLPREPLPRLKMLGFGGDTLDEQTADWWSRQTRLFTLYGPTETTVMASSGEILPGANSRVIGKPIAGYRIYLLNPYKQPVPIGAVGEICIGGNCLGRGYLNRDDQTLERFVIDPFESSPYALMYLTGDLGRFLPDGTIEFFGRNDSQVKVRGFRIELGEIENRIGTFPGIKHVVCATKGEGENRYLAAYFVADSMIDENSLRKHIGEFLPEYMIPSFFVKLDRLPASPSGKIDRKALPAISGKVTENPPLAGLEQQIADIWEKILRFRGVGRNESFFMVGGNSLLAVRMQTELQRELGLEFSIAEFYAAPTIEALASRQKSNYIQMAIHDAHSPDPIVNPASTIANVPPQTVLLTGASGFLGIYLLSELVARTKHVLCLQRCKDESHGMTLLRQQAKKAGVSIDWSRVNIVCGDLATPELGISPSQRQQLASVVDAILHCGAFVHHIHSYQTMKAANVESTMELLKLALEAKRKTFCFVSTLSVASALAGLNAAPEAIVDNLPMVDNGYLLTKWTAEKLVAHYVSQYGLNAIIARPGNITGCSSSGFSNFDHNHFWLFNKGCLQLRAYPEIPSEVEMTPVDLLARAIAAMLVAPRKGLAVRNLANPKTMSLSSFFRRMAECGFEIHGETPQKWQDRLANIKEDNGLAQIKEFYTGDISSPSFPTEQTKTLAELSQLGTELETEYDKIIPIYVHYLRQVGFLS
ncbi:MAG: amino acid adenylation domain-containing protein [Candidatus Riflebacteria bacterium]|nr:amino acid adenylation domain-containing protein [Candidatus Riflebacteria bacterium]